MSQSTTDQISGPYDANVLPYRVAVLCYLYDHEGRLLLLHRCKAPNSGRHSPIGGKLELAEGVWEALITTAAGLVISIIAMTFYSYFRGRVQNHIAELEAAGTHILALIGGQITEERIASQGSHEVYRPAGMSE